MQSFQVDITYKLTHNISLPEQYYFENINNLKLIIISYNLIKENYYG